MFCYPFPAHWKPAYMSLHWKEENPKPAVIFFFFNVASNSAIKRHRGVSPYSRSPPPASACPPRAKPRWVHVKDHMTIGIPDPARDWEWIRPNSSMSQAANSTALETERAAFSTWTHTDGAAFLGKRHIVWVVLAICFIFFTFFFTLFQSPLKLKRENNQDQGC